MIAAFPFSLSSLKPKSDIGRGLGVSLFVHGSVIAALALAAWLNYEAEEPEVEPPKLITFDVPGPSSTDGKVTPKVAPPRALQDSVPSREPVPPRSSESGAGSGQSGVFVWTPAPPVSLVGPTGTTAGVEGARIFLDNLEIPEGASDPILLSFEEAKLNSVAEMEEASRLSGRGAMKMSVQIDAEGMPVLCNIAETSGSQILDQRGCDLIMSYRYRPAYDFTGKARPALIFEWLEWAKTGPGEEDTSLVIPGTSSGAVPVIEGGEAAPIGTEILDVEDFSR